MKNYFSFTILLFFIFVLSKAYPQGDAPALLKGQDQTSKAVGAEIQVVNKGITKISSSKALIETGNDNLLSNPSFEHSTYSTSWTLGGTGTYSAETSTLIHGKKALKVATSSQTVSLTQDSTLYQAQFADSVQCEASVKIKTDSTVAPVICARQAATTSTVDCITAANDNKWATYTIPFICKGTSNGIAIDIASATGTTYIDDAYVGVPKNLSTSSAVGPWISYTTSFTNASCSASSFYYRTNGSNIEVRGQCTVSSVSGLPSFTLPSGFTINTSRISPSLQDIFGFSSLRDTGTRTFVGSLTYKDSDELYVLVHVDTVNSGTSYVSFGNTSSTVPFTWAAGDIIVVSSISIPVNELNGNVTTYSAPTNVNNENVFSAYVTSAGVTTSENVDWISGDFSKASSRYTASLVNTYGTGMACTCSGTLSNGDINCTVTASATQIIVDMETDGVATDNAFQVVCQKQSTDYQASRSIVGSFKDNLIAPGSSQSIIYASRLTCSSSSSIDSQGVGSSWITSIGNVSSGTCAVTLTSGKFSDTPFCWFMRRNATTDQDIYMVTNSATSIDVSCKNQAGTGCTTFSPVMFCLGKP